MSKAYSITYAQAVSAAFVLVLVSRIWPFFHRGKLLPGTHADGAFHYYSELARMSPALFKKDLAVEENQNLGYYEYFYRMLIWLARTTRLGLMWGNFTVCWLGNFLYLAGVALVLERLNVPPVWCGLGVILAAQVYVLIGMWSGVVHSLAIPREFWLFPVPWLLVWFLDDHRIGLNLLAFYAVLGTTYAFTYPLWAVLFGAAFGLADGVRLLKGSDYPNIAWLTAGTIVCAAAVAWPAVAALKSAAKPESCVLNYNQITRSVYLTKGFRRLLIFFAIGMLCGWTLQKDTLPMGYSLESLILLMTVSFVICCVFEPIQQFAPRVSLLYPGRLSLLTYLCSTLMMTLGMSRIYDTAQLPLKGLIGASIILLCLVPQLALRKESRTGNLSNQPDFVRFAEGCAQRTPHSALTVVPPQTGSQYFRVFAERGLWINPKDAGILSRSNSTYLTAQERIALLKRFYSNDTTCEERSELLSRFIRDGVRFIIINDQMSWGDHLGCPLHFASGGWQLRNTPDQETNRT